MKSKHIIWAMLFIASSQLWAQNPATPVPFIQYDDNCGTRGLTRTFPNTTAGTNANVPSARLPIFDWTTDSWGSFNQTGLPPQIIHNPFKDIAGTSNFFSYLDYLWDSDRNPASPAYKTSDGWEFIRTNGLDNPDFFCVTLYNKYQSVLRVVLFSKRLNSDARTLIIKLYQEGPDMNNLNGHATGVLHINGRKNRSMDEKTITTQTSKATIYPGANFYLAHADFPVEFDPCVCHRTGTKFKIGTDYVTSFQTYSYGRSAGVNRTLSAINASGENIDDGEYLTNFNIDNGQSAGVHTSKTFEALRNEYNRISAQAASLGAQLKPYDDVIAVIEATSFATQGVGDILDFAKVEGVKKTTDGIAKGLAGLSKVVSLFSASLRNERDAANNQRNTIANGTSFNSTEYVFHGSITGVNSGLSTLNFYTPGSRQTSSTSQEMPAYNNPLGRYAIWEKPKVDYSFNAQEGTTVLRQAAPIKYVFNPALLVHEETSSVKGSFVVDVIVNPGTSARLINLEIVNVRPNRVTGKDTLVCMTPILPLKDLEKLKFGAGRTIYFQAFTCNDYTPYGYGTPIIGNVDLRLNLVLTYLDPEDQQLFLRGSDGGILTSAIVGTFNASKQQSTTPITFPFPTCSIGLGIFAQTDYAIVTGDVYDRPIGSGILWTGNGLFAGTDADYNANMMQAFLAGGSIPMHFKIYATEFIRISGTVTPPPGCTVEFIAPDIEVLPSAIMDLAVVILNPGNPFETSAVQSRSTPLPAGYCTNGTYKANQVQTLTSNGDEVEDVDFIEKKSSEVIYSFTAAPNPFNEGGVRIDFGLEQAGRCMVTVHDMLGKQVAVLLSTDTAAEGPQQLFWDAADAPMGIYIVTLYTEQGPQSIKVSKQ